MNTVTSKATVPTPANFTVGLAQGTVGTSTTIPAPQGVLNYAGTNLRAATRSVPGSEGNPAINIPMSNNYGKGLET